MAMIPNLLVLVYCYALTNPHAFAAPDVLELHSSLTPASEPLYSSSSAFILSFRPPSVSTTNLFLAISYLLNSSAPGYPVWVANRNTPVSASASLTLTLSGDLLLSDPIVSPDPIWNSNTAGLGVVRAQLLDTGNLVLLNHTSGYVWQSFHYPTDTLLPGQDFTPYSTNLISNKKSDDFLSGRYSLNFTPDGSLQLFYTDSNKSYWDFGKTVFFHFDELGNITFYNSPSSINSRYITNDHGIPALRRITLDMDGNLRLYTWDVASALWKSVWMAFTDVCTQVEGLCGNYGVCTYNPIQPACVCPQGFSVVDSTDLSSGCIANYKMEDVCSTASSKYLEIVHFDYPYNDYLDFMSSSIEECKQYCSRYCKCVIAVYWQSQGHCWLKQSVENGAVRWFEQHRVFLKISEADPLVSTPITDKVLTWSSAHLWQPVISNQSSTVYISSSKHLSTVIALAIFLVIQTVCFAASVAALIKRSKKQLRYVRLGEELEGSLLVFTYEELKTITENFSHRIGAGGFGTVYKGQLENGTSIAVKQLESISQQEKQFRAEIITLGRTHHINLLALVGFCAEGNRRLLVYEYMEKGSPDRLLFEGRDKSGQNDVTLDWSTRFQICLGVARGIHYLHAECLDCVLHCDIKPENVLLDASYCAKVADFGLAYLYSRNRTMQMSTIRGTRGYLAPEWVSNLPITEKADVYSYGMLIMEIISGRNNYLYTESSVMETNEEWSFPLWAYGKTVQEVVDVRLNKFSIDWDQVELVLKVAFVCIQADMNMRPAMGKVVQMLEGMLPVPDTPFPSLFIQKDVYAASSSSKSSDIASSSTSSQAFFNTRNSSARI